MASLYDHYDEETWGQAYRPLPMRQWTTWTSEDLHRRFWASRETAPTIFKGIGSDGQAIAGGTTYPGQRR